MAPQWISAASTLALVAEQSNVVLAPLSICARALAGILKCKARLFTMGEERKENAAVPKEFWWANGHEALDQDWAVGDFATWIDRRIEWRAYGVLFDFNEVRELLPVEQGGILSRQFSVAGNPDWIPSQSAVGFMHQRLGTSLIRGGTPLLDQCRLGFVSARAVLMQRSEQGKAGYWTTEEREWDVPLWFWEKHTRDDQSSEEWTSGIFSGISTGHNRELIKLSGVHFLRASIEAMLPQAALPKQPIRVSGGRPAASFWDDLWCAIWGEIYRGNFHPKRQADVEKAMLEWASNNDEHLSETAAKSRARKLFAEFQSEGKNS